MTSVIQALERSWIRHFGTMNVLQVGEHRAWCSDQMRLWASERNVELMISPGQAHERLSSWNVVIKWFDEVLNFSSWTPKTTLMMASSRLYAMSFLK